MKGSMLQLYEVIALNMRVLKFKLDSQKFEKFAAKKFFLILMRLKKNHNRIMKILITIKSPSLINSKLLLAKLIQVICSIFWTSLFSTESHHQMK